MRKMREIAPWQERFYAATVPVLIGLMFVVMTWGLVQVVVEVAITDG